MNASDRDWLKEMEEYFNSDEGRNSLIEFATKVENEEKLSKELESKSKLCYKNGEKVLIGDVFYYPDEQPRAARYISRINEDETIDACLHCTIALKMTNCYFDQERAVLVERNGKLHNPLDEIFEEKY
jgi:hypothetical protein